MAHVLKEYYAPYVEAILRKGLVTKENLICNTKYEKDPVSGAILIPFRDGETVVGDYSKTNLASNSMKYGSTAYLKASIGADKYINEYIDSYEAEALPDTVGIQRISSATYALAEISDSQCLSAIVNAVQGKDKAGTTFASTDPRYQKAGTLVAKTALTGEAGALDYDDAYKTCLTLSKALNKKHVPKQGRWLIVDSEFEARIMDSDKAIRQGNLSQELIQKGCIAKIAGFDVYSSENMGKGADITISATAYYGVVGALAGHYDYVTRIEYWVKKPYIADLNNTIEVVGGCAVKARVLIEHEVTRPEAFAMLTYPVAKS
jgi:hypothetical protein